ncbi:S-layer homology domain-containing protein [Anoxybacillus rupiensis]|uniref:S-layer homology domain-containing protein n=1 Tax=Anoxybacteroides rupiense TaxID=311460 RepID=UPI001BA6B712|nr:S-layer homology domain-containing protein [Anoxybacillus rupiensis]MBS2772750.1 S-layer homology domain-containing protein [Anoxybacillus rupiensis]
MAYQPKSYRKFLAGSVSAALVATAVGPVVASAASFSDVNPNDSHAANIEKLVEKGYIKGYEDGTFKPYNNVTRGQVAKIFARILKDNGFQVPADKKAFDDVPVDAKDQELVEAAAIVKAAGVMTGNEGKLNPTQTMTRQQMAKVLVEAFDLTKPADFTSKITDLDKADEWARDYIKTLEANGVTVVTEYNPKGTVTRAAFASFVVRALEAQEAAKDVKVESVSAIGAKKLEVKFNKAVDPTKAKFDVKKAGITVNVSNVVFASDNKSATLELSTKLTKGEYVVNVTGVANETLTKSVQVEDEKVASIEILSDVAVVDNTAAPTKATVAYQVKNQYGEDITKTTSLTTNDPTNIVTANGVVTVTLSGTPKVGDKLPVTLIHVDSATTASKVVTLSAASTVTDITVSGVYNKDGKQLNEDSNLSSDSFYLLVDLKDQYGNTITNETLAESGLIKAQSNPTVVGTAGTGSNVDLTPLTIDGKQRLGIKLTGPVQAGENLVTLISTTSGKSATYKISVAETTRTDAVTLSSPALAVANEDIFVPATVLDKDGKAITDVKVLNDATKGVKVSYNGSPVSNAFVLKDNSVYVKIPAITVATDGVFALVAQSSTYKVATLTLNVKKAAEPTVIRGLKSTVSPTLKDGTTKQIDVSDLVIEDQYGRVMDSAKVKAGLTGGKKIVVKDVDPNSNVVVPTGDITSTTTATLTAGTTNGTEKLQFVLNDGTKDILSSTAEVTFRVTNGTEYVSYQVDDIGTVYDESGASKNDDNAYDKAIKVYGVLNDGSKVLLTPGTDYTVTSTNTDVQADAADGTIDADGLTLNYGTDKTEVVIPITVTINATGQQFTKDVTFSKVAPKVTAVKVVDTDSTNDDALTAIKHNIATAGDFTIADLTTGSTTGYNIVVTDQYGVSVLATADTGAISFADGTTVAAPNLTVAPVTGSISITNNGLSSATVTAASLSAGETFDVVISYAGGAKATVRVVAE